MKDLGDLSRTDYIISLNTINTKLLFKGAIVKKDANNYALVGEDNSRINFYYNYNKYFITVFKDKDIYLESDIKTVKK